MKNTVDFIGGGFIVIGFVVFISWASWTGYSYVNWKFNTKDKVEKMIETKVKRECLNVQI